MAVLTSMAMNTLISQFGQEVNNDSILMGDRKALLPAVDVYGVALPEPDAEDFVIGFGDTVKIVSTQKIYHADTLVCYICQVRE
jgi:hypothetical protein